MENIIDVERNFKFHDDVPKTGVSYYDVSRTDFCLYGIKFDDGMYRRLPENVAKRVSAGVHRLHNESSGGRIRFITDSPYVVLKVRGRNLEMSRFDVYVNGKFKTGFDCGLDAGGAFEKICFASEAGHKDITIYFPVSGILESVVVGVKEGASFLRAEHRCRKKVVFYGSSITQGAIVSRPGVAYVNSVGRRFDFDYVTLGFAGNALAEPEMARYCASLKPDIFVMDYDHNASSCKMLKDTHEPFFKLFRSFCPDTAVLMLTAPNYPYFEDEWLKRRDIIRETYENAVADGDKNVYMLDCSSIWGEEWDSCTIDGIHPNDLGAFRMAEKIGDVLGRLL